MKIAKNLHWFIYAIFLFACARQSSPTGGPKDTIPPILVRSFPPNESLRFNAKEIELVFSENVILNSPKEQLIVTPTIGKDYKIAFRKNTVTISLEDPLLDSTTYTFNFRETVQDITEKNPVENLQLAYSTGEYIDSLSIKGTIYDLLKGKPVKDATVALHLENDTFNILEHPAVYFTKTNERGEFHISHLKPENYFLYAFEDKNRNLIVNTRSESYGFKSEYEYLIENLENLSLGLVRLDAGPLKITSARPYNTYFNIRTSKNLRTFTLSATDSSELHYTFGENQANIRLYDTTEKDSLQIHLIAIDSIDNAIDTTLYAKFLTREVTPEKFDMSLQTSSIMAHRGDIEAILTFTKPIKAINFDSIAFQIDSLNKINFTKEDLILDPLSGKLTMRKKASPSFFQTDQAARQRNDRRAPGQTQEQPPENLQPINELRLGRAAFISVENDSSGQIVQALKPLREEELSVIHITIETDEKSYLVQLIDNNYKVIRQIKNIPKVTFRDVVPGEYQIRLVIDRNDNGRWDPGNYSNGTEPEPVIFYRASDGSPNIRGVKANWEVGAGEMFITY
jgi:uncharacterized protein (DUF2141 family)